MTLRSISLVLVLTAGSASAQLSIRYYRSHPPKDGPIPQVCLDAGSLRTEMAKFALPPKWTFVIACDAAAWDDLMALSNHVEHSRLIFGATNRTTRPRS